MQDLKNFVKDNFELHASTYREWVAMVRIYFKDVLLRYDFLAEGLDPALIPNIEDRETGLVSLVLSKMLPHDTAKRMHDEFLYDFKKKNRNYTLVYWITAFQAKTDSYVQLARDSMALEAAIAPKVSHPLNSPVYARRYEYTPERFTENYSPHNKSEAKTVLFVEDGNDDHNNYKNFSEDFDYSNTDINNPNLEEIGLESSSVKIAQNW